MSKAALEAEVRSLRAENDSLRRTLSDLSARIMSGRLTGELPDNFLEQFSHLPDRPLEQVLRFLPARQVVQMRRVSRKFNRIIKKSSKTMPKSGSHDDSVVFKRYVPEELVVDFFNSSGCKVTKIVSTAHLEALSELLRFIRIDCQVFFGQGLSAADEVLHQLSKAWLTIRPESVVFSGDLSQTSPQFLKAFLVKVEPYIVQLHFQNASNIGDRLLSDELIGAAGQLDGLIVLPKSGDFQQYNIRIGDETLLSLANSEKMPSYVFTSDCTSFTPGGIRAFVEKWIKKEKPQIDPKSAFCFEWMGWETCELTFYKCANVTPAAVEEACGDLLKKEAILGFNASSVNDSEETGGGVRYTIKCTEGRRELSIRFYYDLYRAHLIQDPGWNGFGERHYDDYNSDPEIDYDDFDDYVGYDAIDYDDDDSDLV